MPHILVHLLGAHHVDEIVECEVNGDAIHVFHPVFAFSYSLGVKALFRARLHTVGDVRNFFMGAVPDPAIVNKSWKCTRVEDIIQEWGELTPRSSRYQQAQEYADTLPAAEITLLVKRRLDAEAVAIHYVTDKLQALWTLLRYTSKERDMGRLVKKFPQQGRVRAARKCCVCGAPAEFECRDRANRRFNQLFACDEHKKELHDKIAEDARSRRCCEPAATLGEEQALRMFGIRY